jgi:para-nitrobenzyl esterase
LACDDDKDAEDHSQAEEPTGTATSHSTTSHEHDNDAGPNPGTSAPKVTVEDGALEGAIGSDGKVRAFLGIPYAKPPVGPLRFKAAERPAKWSGTREAKEYGGRCAQLESKVLMNAGSEDEDCLYLNVWTPSPAPKTKLPVMFWIHGGGNVNGSASEPVPYLNSEHFYSGEQLSAKTGVVVVSLNYRLGVFGFFAHAGLTDEDAPLGNQGLWDQQFALSWVKRNIAAFGGDPSQVTIFGESAGSQDVCLHVASPKTRGLFARAISESGGCTTFGVTLEDAEKRAADFADKLGCGGDDALACLRAKPVSGLLAAATGFGPIVDGEFMPEQPRALYDRGDIAKVPYILGSNTDEGTLFTTTQVHSEDELKAAIQQSVTAPVDEVLEHYPLSAFQDTDNPYQAALARIIGDSILVCSTYDAAIRHAAAGGDTYLYNFDIPTNAGNQLGATHGSELVYVFGTSPNLTPEQQKTSDAIQAYWTNLAKHGDPNGKNLLTWPQFDDEHNDRINFGLDITTVHDFRKPECEYWRSQYDAKFHAK